MTQHKCVLCGKPDIDMQMWIDDDVQYIYYHYACGENKELVEKYNKKVRG